MTTGQQAHTLGLPVTSTLFVHFALDVIDLLKQSSPGGLDQDGFLAAYFTGRLHRPPPTNQADRDAWWDEFKRAKDYSNARFEQGISPWAWIRARPGGRRGQYYYLIVGDWDSNGRVKIQADAADLDLLDDFTDRRWRTQTQSRQRVVASHGIALINEGNARNDPRLVARGKELLNQFITLSPGLAAINFGSGIVMDDLHRLVNSRDPHIRLLNRPLRDAIRSGTRFQRDVSVLVSAVHALANIYQNGSMKSLP